MKLLKTLALLCGLALVGRNVHAASTNFYTYSVSESLPCNSPNCANGASIDLLGTITTDALGSSLSANDIVVWDLSITLTGQPAIRLTQNKGEFSTFGSPQISATASDLTIARNTTSQGFQFSGSSTAPASWLYGGLAQVLFYNTVAGDQFTAQQILSTPSTFTAPAVSTAETPEPATVPLTLMACLALLTIAAIRQRIVRQA